MGTQRNYLINTTTISTTASGTTIASGNTQNATFELARTLVRTGIGAAEFASGSQTWAVHYVVSAMTTPYEMRLKVQRRNSSGTMQAETGYGTTRSATGTYDDNLSADLGTWAANDQLALVWEHRRPSGSGNKTGTIDANGSSYIDAPTSVSDLPETLSDNHNTLADAAPTIVIGIPKSFSESINNLADAHTEVLGLRLTFTDDANLLADYFVYGKRPRWQDSFTKTVDSGPALGLALSDNINNLADAYAQVGPVSITCTDSLPALSDTVWYSNKPRWRDSYAQIEDQRLSFAESINNLADAYSQVEGQLKTFSEDINILADSLTKTEGQLVPCSDSVNAWLDACSLGEGQIVPCSDSIFLTDSYGAIESGFLPLSDSFNLDDNIEVALGASGGEILADSFTLTDAFQFSLGLPVVLSDDLNNWQDVLSLNVPHPSIIIRVRRDDRSVTVEP
jgi:hypothetical protein